MCVCVTADVLGAAPKHPAMPFMSQVTRQPIGRARGIGSAAPRSALATAAAPSTAAAAPAPVAAAAVAAPAAEVVAAAAAAPPPPPPPPPPAPTAAANARIEPGATILQLSGQPPSAPSAAESGASSVAAASAQDTTAAVRPLYTKLREMDREQCGLVTPAELRAALAQCDAGATPARVDALAAKYDTARTCVQPHRPSPPHLFLVLFLASPRGALLCVSVILAAASHAAPPPPPRFPSEGWEIFRCRRL